MTIYLRLKNTLIRALLTTSILVVSSFPSFADSNLSTALDEYVNTADDAYTYQHFGSLPGAGFTLHVFSMTSQQWRTVDEVDQTLWSHWLSIVVPDTVATETAMMIVDGGRNRPLPNLNSSTLAAAGQIALSTQSIVTVITQVPNQALTFPDEPDALTEDSLVAYSWDKAMRTGDPTWSVYLPMVKSVVRAMDTVQEVTPVVAQKNVSDFVMVGFSKRGAITTLTGAVDQRVKAIAPGVYDFLNMAPHMEHHYSSYGSYSPGLIDYVNYDFVRRVRTPEGQDLLTVNDPYSYRDRLTMPKFLINSTGDYFFPSDSARHYYQDLPDESLIRYVPNTDHPLADASGSRSNAITSLLSWYGSILFDVPRPLIKWEKQSDAVTVTAFPPPVAATLWRATNSNGRDFRRETIGEAWLPQLITGSGNGIYQLNLEAPTTGWNAYYLELIYPGVGGIPQTYGTRVFITPDVLPFEVSDPVIDPKGKGFWAKQITTAVTGKGHQKIDTATLQSYFPVPIFNTHIKNINEAYNLFRNKQHNSDNKALQHCLSLRLNIAHKELGWYSRPDIENEDDDETNTDNEEENMLLWELWQTAHDAYLAGEPNDAKQLCEQINEI